VARRILVNLAPRRLGLLGGSFDRGSGLMDDETLPREVQEHIQGYDVREFVQLLR